MSMPANVGRRLLPSVLDELSERTPDRLYASIPRLPTTLAHGFRDITVKDIAQCCDVTAHWLHDRFGRSENFETLCYIGTADIRGAILFLAAIKCSFKVIFPSPRNPATTNRMLLEQTSCNKLVYAQEVIPVINSLKSICSGLDCVQIASLEDVLDKKVDQFPYTEQFDEAVHHPIIILHSSGSTGLPKPVTMTHGTFTVLDMERNLPKTPGRKNRDFSIWDFGPGGGRFYTCFPYFHLAGFLATVVNPIFTEISSPVLGPATIPPSAGLLRDVMSLQNLSALYIPPSLAEQLLQQPGSVELFKSLDFLCYTGGPFSRQAGETLARTTELVTLYGSTEAFQVPQLAPKDPVNDFAYMEWNPCFKLQMQASEEEPEAFEMVLFADDETANISALNHNFPGVSEWRTKDLFKRHPDPQKSNLWTYHGRRDDIVVLSNGEKFNPVPMELMIQRHPKLAGALITGLGGSQAALLLESNPDVGNADTVIREVWALVEQANQLAPAQGWISRSKVLVSRIDKHFIRAGKGTVVRKMTENLYRSEIQSLFVEGSQSLESSTDSKPTLRPTFPLESVLDFVRKTVILVLPNTKALPLPESLIDHGLDSVKCTELCQRLKTGLQSISHDTDVSWISNSFLFEHSTLETLSTAIHEFVDTGKVPKTRPPQDAAGRAREIEDIIAKSIRNLPSNKVVKERYSESGQNVALTGSTGFLGTELLHQLLKDPEITNIFCLNRDPKAKERQEKTLLARFPIEEHTIDKASYLTVEMDKPNLGLETLDFQFLLENTTTVIHNAWKVDFYHPLSAFESQMRGLQNIIAFGAKCRYEPHIMFTSSVASILNSAAKENKVPLVEDIISDSYPVPLQIGYAESKYIAERVLKAANQRLGLPVSILRTGQIGGSTKEHDIAEPRFDWLLALIKASRTIGVIPDTMTFLDWIPINEVGQVILDIFHSKSTSVNPKVHNLVHPSPLPWKIFLDVLSEEFYIKPEPVPLRKWVEKVGAEVGKPSPNPSTLPAARTLDFFKACGDGLEVIYETENSRRASETFQQLQPITKRMITTWLKQCGVQQ